MPLVQQPRAPKHCRLQAPFNFAPRMEGLEEAMKELWQDVKAVLVKQTEILTKILGVLYTLALTTDPCFQRAHLQVKLATGTGAGVGQHRDTRGFTRAVP